LALGYNKPYDSILEGFGSCLGLFLDYSCSGFLPESFGDQGAVFGISVFEYAS